MEEESNSQDVNKDEDSTQQSTQVGLRSDIPAGFVKAAWSSSYRWWLVGMAVVFVLLIISVGLLSLFGLGGTNEDEVTLLDRLPSLIGEGRPLNVSAFSGQECEEANRRPIGVMLAADQITRPVAGFATADMVWELPVLVSDVTRLLAIYQCGRPDDIGSVRSARHDYLFLVEGVDAIMGHWGGSYHALNRIQAGEFDTINALTNPFGAYFRKEHLPAPYNGFTNYENLWNALQKLGYRTTTKFDAYDFKDDVDLAQRPPGGTLSIGWPGVYRVHYEYDPTTNRYQRFWGGVKQVDGGDGAVVAPSAVVIMRATNAFADGPGGYNDVGIEGEGALAVYQDGQVLEGTWRKDENQKTDPVHFLDGQGEPITFTRGQLWVMAVEPGVTVTWEEEQPAEPAVSPEADVVVR